MMSMISQLFIVKQKSQKIGSINWIELSDQPSVVAYIPICLVVKIYLKICYTVIPSVSDAMAEPSL